MYVYSTEEALSSPQPKFEHSGWTFEGCLLLHRLLVSGEEEKVLRRINEVPSEIVQVSRPSLFLTKKTTTPIPLLMYTCQCDKTCNCKLGLCLECDGHFYKRTKVMFTLPTPWSQAFHSHFPQTRVNCLFLHFLRFWAF